MTKILLRAQFPHQPHGLGQEAKMICPVLQRLLQNKEHRRLA